MSCTLLFSIIINIIHACIALHDSFAGAVHEIDECCRTPYCVVVDGFLWSPCSGCHHRRDGHDGIECTVLIIATPTRHPKWNWGWEALCIVVECLQKEVVL